MYDKLNSIYLFPAYFAKLLRRTCSKVIPGFGGSDDFGEAPLEEAKVRCDEDPRCTGVLNTNCQVSYNGLGIYLCEGEILGDDKNLSCAYQKGIYL